MPRYAIVAVVHAQEPEEAWQCVSERLLDVNKGPATYVGAPWLVPEDTDEEPEELETDGIQLRLDGKRVTLGPID